MKKNKELLNAFERQMDLCVKIEKLWFWAAFLLLILYVELVIFCQNVALGYIDSPILNLLLAIAIVPFCFIGLLLVRKWEISGENHRAKNRTELHRRLFFAAIVWAGTFVIFLLCLWAYWPGAFSLDSLDQYGQVYSGEYDNWHPVLHTWLFFWIPFHLFRGPEGIVLAQIFWFSLAVTYLFYVLYTSGCPKTSLICGWLYIVINPNTLGIMMYPWKDCAMTIFSTVMFAQLVRIYLTKGDWLKKWYNLAAFSVSAFLTMEMRHNAVLLVASVFVVLIWFFQSARKKTLLSAFIVLLAHSLLQGPIFSLMDVTPPDKRTMETMGLPMTILSDIYVQDRNALSEEALSFMDSLTAQNNWNGYALGSFNSIKWTTSSDVIEEAGFKRILQYAADAAMSRRRMALKGFSLLTRIVWQVDGQSGWDFFCPSIENNSFGIYDHGNKSLRKTFNCYATLISTYATKYLFCYTGVVILVLLFLAVGHLGNGNLCRSFLVLTPMAYNFGTMLLLSGHDFRFFHFNFVIVVPLVYLMLQREGSAANETAQKPPAK